MAEDLEATATLTKGAGEREGEGEARGAMLYVVLRAGRPSAGASRHRLTGEARLGRGSRFRAEREGDRLSLKLADAAVSSAHAALVPSGAGHRLVDLGSKNGTELDGARVTEAPLHDGALIGVGGSLLLYRNPTRLGEDRDSVEGAEPRGLLTLVPSLEASWDKLRRVAASTQTVVLGGESGTGKEVTARAIHALSGRRGRLVAVNCGALPDSLIESQLFGHERGAFSGADEARDGLVQAADGGTLFLDEIG
ncbi:MAG: sigma 54-interacting transcriptional regulator, partial [Myxococcales bacterium]|nr:sigma 54-interacting transcriptional regulator [Myxococcales bacterium]